MPRTTDSSNSRFELPPGLGLSLFTVAIAATAVAWTLAGSPAAAQGGPLAECVPATLPGDANADGAVDGNDADAVRDVILGRGSAVDPDCNGDGAVDVLDVLCTTARILDPPSPDGDGDGLTDDEEVTAGTDSTLLDSDGDGVCDGLEVDLYGTDPILADSDGDGFGDGDEIVAGSDPNDPGDMPLSVRFETNGTQVSEAAGTVVATAVFSRPVPDGVVLHIATGGTASILDDIEETAASLVLEPGATRVDVPVTLVDDGEFEELERITLSIGDGDYFVAAPSEFRITIDDNDQLWEASLQTGSETVAVTLEIQRQDGGTAGQVVGGRGGIVPAGSSDCLSTGEPACWRLDETELTDHSFAAVLVDPSGCGSGRILYPEDSALYGSGGSLAVLGFTLDTAGCEGAQVTSTLIEGCLEMTFAAARVVESGDTLAIECYLETVVTGRFAMSSHPTAPSSAEVPLCDTPPCE